MLFPQVYPNEATGVEDHLLSMLVGLCFIVGIELLNLTPNLLVKLLDLLDSLDCLYL